MKDARTVRRGDHVLAHAGQTVPTLLLGALLLKMSQAPIGDGADQWMLAVVMNLCIGLAMLFIPLATKSLINDGFEGAASAMSAAPALAGLGAVKGFSRKAASKAKDGAKKSMSYSVRPARNLMNRGVPHAKEKLNTRANIERPISNFNRKYSELGMNEEQKQTRRSKIYKQLKRQKRKERPLNINRKDKTRGKK